MGDHCKYGHYEEGSDGTCIDERLLGLSDNGTDDYDPPDGGGSEDIGSGGAVDSDATYRRDMIDAGRGSLLR